MIRAGLLVWLALLPAPALAQDIAVRSGAHERFDRLVIDLPERIGWQLETRARRATVIFERSALGFDLAAVFDRIGRDRLLALSAPPGQGRLVLDLACDCVLRPFWHGATMFVLDIADPPEDTPPPPASKVVLPAPAPHASPAARALEARLAAEAAPAPEPRAGPPPAAAPDLAGMRTLLLYQLGRATAQGLVRAVAAAPRAAHAAPEPSTPEPPAQARPAPAPAIALSARTAMDRESPPSAGPAPDADRIACPAPEALDLSAWDGGAPLPLAMGRLRRSLVGEFDHVDRAAALALARLHVHHGFGAEARQVLALLPDPDAGTRLLGELALLVEEAPLPEDALLRQAIGCGAPTLLWALLAQPRLASGQVFDHQALERSFAALPAGLRRTLGPGLVRRLAAVGHVRTADHLQRMLERAAPAGDPAARVSRAALSGRGAAPAEDALAAAGRSNTLHAAEALARSLETALARGAPVALPQAQLAGAYALELRETALGARLAAAHVAALGASGAFDEAVAELARLAPDPGRPEARAMAADLLRTITSDGDDITFLRHALPARLAPPETLSPPLAGAVARRLLAAGLAEAALRYLPRDTDDPDLRLLRAEIALARARPAEAERSLVALEGAEADRLRARARMMRGDHRAAQALFESGGDPAGADRAAWLAGEAAALAQARAPLLRDLAEVMERPAAAGISPGAPLLDAPRAVLAEAEAARAILARLLAQGPGPGAAPR